MSNSTISIQVGYRICGVLHFGSRNDASYALYQSKTLIGNRIRRIKWYHLQAAVRRLEAEPEIRLARLAISTSAVLFSARCNTYISRLCYDVSVRLPICLRRECILWSRCMPGRGEGSSRAMLATSRPSCCHNCERRRSCRLSGRAHARNAWSRSKRGVTLPVSAIATVRRSGHRRHR